MFLSDCVSEKVWRSAGILSVLLLVSAFAGAQQVSLTPEEVSGLSIRQIDGIRQMTPQFAVSPTGQEVPRSEDDQWLPDLSLASTSTDAAVPTTTTATAPALTAARPLAERLTPRTNASTAQNSAYDAGFLVDDVPVPLDPNAVPNPPALNNAAYLNETSTAYASSQQPAATVVSTAAPTTDYAGIPLDAPDGADLPQSAEEPNAPSAAEPAAPVVPDLPNATPESAASAPNPENLIIADIRCSEGMEMPISRFNKLVKTKIGATFSQQRLEEDKRALLQTKQYVDVIVSTTMIPDEPDKVIVNFDFTPRRQMKYIKILGNKKLSKSEILEELGMKRGESRMDPYDVENGRIRIIELYKSKEYSEPYVEIFRGNRPEDVGVVYMIDEGEKQRVLKTTFTGNTVVSSARLKSIVSVKPGIFYLIGGNFSRDRLDEDVTTLLEFYRNLGYFDARVDRRFEESEGYTGLGKENGWITVHYIIDEGPRYKIRNFLFEGNRVLATDELTKKLKVKSGDYFNRGELEGDRVLLANSYQDIGYVRAEITPTQIYTEDEGMIDIRYRIDEDYRYRIKDIVIKYEGEEARTKASVIMNMLDFAPNQLAIGPKIRNSETNLKRSGFFNDKPNEGPLPSIAIIPEETNHYYVESSAESKAPTKEKNQDDSKKLFFLGKKESGDSKQKPSDRPKTEDGTPQDNALPSYGQNVVRGQSREIPTGFSSTTTRTASAAAPAGQVWNGSNYISYSNANPPISTSPSPYADTSMYNNGVAGSSMTDTLDTAPAASAAAPPLNDPTAAASGLYSGTVTGAIDPSQPVYSAAAPGFAAAGRDAVFPGTQQQQYLNNQLLGPGTLDPNAEPIRDATAVASIMEGRTGMIQASVGVNSNYGLIGNLSYTERNFDITRFPTAFWRPDGWTDAFRGAGQLFRVEASPGTELQRYSVSWDVPHIWDSAYNFGVTGMYGDRYYDDWYESRFGGELRFGRQWTNRFSTTINAGLYDVRIYRPSVTYVPDLNEVLGHNSLYSIGLSTCYDTRNHPYMPSEGYVIEGGAEQILGSWSYPRVSYDARAYFTLHKRADGSGRKVLGLRSAAGWTGNKTPIYDRYYGGGYANLRGFEYREVTPRYLNTGFGIGGNFEFYNSAEVLVPVSGGDEFQLAFFIDTGTVSPKINDWDKYRVAPGFGLRIAIPMLGPAPLALDFAFPVVKGNDDIKEVFSFSIMGSR